MVAGAGVVDGFNPCSFAGLLVFASFTVASASAACHASSPTMPSTSRRVLAWRGSAYILGIFLIYVLVGLGILGSIRVLAEQHWAGRIAALLSLLIGLWMLRDGLLPDAGLRLGLPARLTRKVRPAMRRASVPAALAAGALIGLCTIPCTGGIYLGVLALLGTQADATRGFLLFLLYNVAFVVPLIAILVAGRHRSTQRILARWSERNESGMRILLGAVTIALALLTLMTTT
jgi:cytochrome c biogenesis protein CcdA